MPNKLCVPDAQVIAKTTSRSIGKTFCSGPKPKTPGSSAMGNCGPDRTLTARPTIGTWTPPCKHDRYHCLLDAVAVSGYTKELIINWGYSSIKRDPSGRNTVFGE